mgnify:CR=1 FL=1
MKNIILVGIMGCGKTTISKLLSEKLNMPVIDMDEYLEKKAKTKFNNDITKSVEDYKVFYENTYKKIK